MGVLAFIFTLFQWFKLCPSLGLSIWPSETGEVIMLLFTCGYL